MLDDDHDTDDLDVDMTAADVFVDRGLAQIDARDQRGTLRVIQKPTPYSPARFPSVTLDWDAAAEDYERRIQDKREAATNSVHKFPTIPEEDSQAGSVSGSQDDDRQRTPTPIGNITPAHETDDLERRRNTPVLSVEKEHEIPGSPALWDEQPHVQEQYSQDNNEKTIEATPQRRRFESQELGGSPTPSRPSAPSEKTAATSQPRAPVGRGRAANRTINRIASESKSPPPGIGQHLTEQTPPLGHKTRSLTRRRISQLMKPVEHGDDDDGGEANEQDNERREEEVGEDGHVDDDDGDVAMDDGGIAPGTFISATEEVPEPDLTNDDAPETRRTRLGKRKKSQEDLQSNKEPRLDRAGTPTQETPEPRNSSPSAMQKRERAPSFSRSGHRPSIMEQSSPPKPGLGLGITKSPPQKQPTKSDFSKGLNKNPNLVFVNSTKNMKQPSSQASITAAPMSLSGARKSLTQNDSTSAKPQTPADKVKSALRKEASIDKRRSVSFSEKNSVFPVTVDSQSRSPSGPAAKEPEKAKDKAWGKPPTPGITVYPGGVTPEKLQQIFEEQQREAEKKKQEQEEMDQEMREAAERNASPEYLELLADIQRTRAFISENKNSGRQKTQKQVTSYRTKLDAQLRELEYLKANLSGHSKTPEKRRKKKRASQAAAEEKSEVINTPSSTVKEPAKKTNAARRESSSKRTRTKSPPKKTESEEAAPTETTNDDSAQTTEAEASQEPETAPVETPSQSKRKPSPADKAQNKEPITASVRRAHHSHRSLRAVDGADGADAMDIDQPSQPQPEHESQQEKKQEKEPEEQQVNGQEMEAEEEPEHVQEEEQEQEQPEEPEHEPEPRPQDEEGDGDGTEEQQRSQEQEQTEAQEPESEPEPEPEPEQQPEPGQHEPEKELDPKPEPAQKREPELEQQPEPEPEAEQEAEPRSEQQPQEPEEPEEQPQEQPAEQPKEQPQEPEMVPETSQPEPQKPRQAESEPPEQQSPQKPQSQQSRLLSQEQSQSLPMSDDVNLPEMETIRTLDQSKKPKEQPTPQSTTEEPKPASSEQGKDRGSSMDDNETDSETGSGSDSDSDSDSDDDSGSDDDEEQGPELTKADLLRRANGTNGTSSARNSMTKSPAPSQQQLPQSQPLPQNRYSSPRGSSQPPVQSQPQPHIQPFQSVNKLSSARASLQGLRNVITAQKQNYDAQLQEARMATVTRKKDVFDPPSDSESEDDSESDSDSDSSDSDNESDADDGDIQSSGMVGRLRKALQKK